MTLQADKLRSERQQFAAPGGAHDRLVHFLNAALPMGVGAVVAVMLVSPLFPRSEVSFLLDRLRNETITRVRVIFAPELRDAMREALIR